MDNSLLNELRNSKIPLLNNSQLKFLNDANSYIKERTETNSCRDLILRKPDDETSKIVNQIEAAEKNFKIIINHLKYGSSVKKCFMETYPIWKKIREDAMVKLKEIANSINTDRFNCNVSKLVGFSTSLVGGTATLVSAALIPFTLGLTTPLFIAGSCATAAGVSTAIGTSVTEIALLNKKIKIAQEIIKKDQKYFQKMSDWLTHVRELEEAIAEVLNIDIMKDVANGVKKFVEDAFNIRNEYGRHVFTRAGINEIFSCIPENIRNVVPRQTIGKLIMVFIAFFLLIQNRKNRLIFDFAVATMRGIIGIASLIDDTTDIVRLVSLFTNSAELASTISKAIMRGALAAIGMALDVTAIVLTSLDVHNGSASPQAKQINELIEEMEKESRAVGRVYSNLN